ncbi:MAG: hypothetical protein NTY15_05205 [Planctomycetota bacterium]|nr:hypothetical protein [Planctomycetota bacterium]
MSVCPKLFSGFQCGRIRIACTLAAILVCAGLARHVYQVYQWNSDQANIAILNQKVLRYQREVGALPDLNLVCLYDKGLSKQRLHRTPFGGYYRFDPSQLVVYNPTVSGR